jgi:hypothetical protein
MVRRPLSQVAAQNKRSLKDCIGNRMIIAGKGLFLLA